MKRSEAFIELQAAIRVVKRRNNRIIEEGKKRIEQQGLLETLYEYGEQMLTAEVENKLIFDVMVGDAEKPTLISIQTRINSLRDGLTQRKGSWGTCVFDNGIALMKREGNVKALESLGNAIRDYWQKVNEYEETDQSGPARESL
jgi:hypothetical protein